jgi:hypothetical protein
VAKFKWLKSKTKVAGYPVKLEVTIENDSDLLAIYGWINYPRVRVAKYYETSKRAAVGAAVRLLDKSCIFDRIKSLAKERNIALPPAYGGKKK